MNIPPTKACCLSSCLHRRHSPTLSILVVFTLHRSRKAPARHPARQRFPLIRHLIRQRKLPAQHCGARLRCGEMLSILRYARGRNLRLQICHFLAVSLLSLSLITTNTLSNHSLITLICLFTCVFTLSDTHCSCCQLTQTFFHISNLYSLRHSLPHSP
jgi:hypothetical protein